MMEQDVRRIGRDTHLTLSHRPLRGSLRLALTVALVLPLGFACRAEDDGSPARDGTGGPVAQADEAPGPAGAQGVLSDSTASAQVPRIPTRERAQQPLRLSDLGYNEGSPEAPLKVLELSDFGCGYCRRFHEQTYPRLKEIYVDAGLMEWKFIPFVLGKFPNGLQAAIAGECAGEQEMFFPMSDRLFGDQSGWTNRSDPYPFFYKLAEEEGLDVERFESCIEGGWRESRVKDNVRVGQQLGARGTPVFIVDGMFLEGAPSLDEFRNLLDAALRRRGIKPPRR